ncbi:MAG: hypothetical protein KIS94_09210 [Chitinophagales bacterium]|nr:hypothetical protein [Chitinophagales bacterium]
MPIRSQSNPNKVYKFIHRTNVAIKTNLTGREFLNRWLHIVPDGTITLLAGTGGGYAWDGCTPKANWLDLTFGTPDGRLDYTTEQAITYYASMFHDVMYQYYTEVPISRKEADILFHLNLSHAGFKLAKLYYLGVRLGGGSDSLWKHTQTHPNPIIESRSWLPRQTT